MGRKKKKFEEIKPDMTPMIDVTFLLLIFFIVTLKFKVLEGRLDAALPKDRGTNTSEAEEIEKLDIMLFVAEPGDLIADPDNKNLKMFSGRRIRVEIGAQKWYYDPFNLDDPENPLPDLTQFLKDPAWDREETPVSLDARKGIVYGDVIVILDVVIREKFQKVSFAGTFEQD
ncbi:MAG: biopolymer transporter ExbD [Planctomycetota bacterium]|nr:biopolymer transporter ExbD [Planctomycetota bacterium]MDA1114423.1 biopolymer transporter ExbD [Planctomycetota bacterium]